MSSNGNNSTEITIVLHYVSITYDPKKDIASVANYTADLSASSSMLISEIKQGIIENYGLNTGRMRGVEYYLYVDDELFDNDETTHIGAAGDKKLTLKLVPSTIIVKFRNPEDTVFREQRVPIGITIRQALTAISQTNYADEVTVNCRLGYSMDMPLDFEHNDADIKFFDKPKPTVKFGPSRTADVQQNNSSSTCTQQQQQQQKTNSSQTSSSTANTGVSIGQNNVSGNGKQTIIGSQTSVQQQQQQQFVGGGNNIGQSTSMQAQQSMSAMNDSFAGQNITATQQLQLQQLQQLQQELQQQLLLVQMQQNNHTIDNRKGVFGGNLSGQSVGYHEGDKCQESQDIYVNVLENGQRVQRKKCNNQKGAGPNQVWVIDSDGGKSLGIYAN